MAVVSSIERLTRRKSCEGRDPRWRRVPRHLDPLVGSPAASAMKQRKSAERLGAIEYSQLLVG